MAATGFSQDLIVKKDGSRIFCRITGEDSLSVYYIRRPQKKIYEIRRTEIEDYYRSNPSKAALVSAPDSLVKKRSKNNGLLLGFSGGLSVPFAEFASDNLYDPASGFALKGGMFHAELNGRVAGLFRLSAAFHFQSHPFNTRALDRQYGNMYPNASFSTQSGNWTSSGVQFGANFSCPFPDLPRLSFELQLAGGITKCVYPESSTVITQRNIVVGIIYQLKGTAWAFSLTQTAGFRYMVDKNVGFTIGAGVFYAKPAFKNLVTQSTAGNVQVGDYVQKMAVFNVHGGIVFSLF